MREYSLSLSHSLELELILLQSLNSLEKIKEEVEARRTMPEALRLKEDTERADKTRKEKKKGSQGTSPFNPPLSPFLLLTKTLNRNSLPSKVSPQRSFPSRSRYPQETRLHGSNTFHGRCLFPPRSTSEEELR